MNKWVLSLLRGCAALLALLGASLGAPVALALGWDPSLNLGEVDECMTIGTIQGVPVPRGELFVGSTVVIDADHIKLINESPNCSYHAAIPDFSWELVAPMDSEAELMGITTLTPQVTIDLPGTYTVKLTPCPDGCLIQAIGYIPPHEPIVRSFVTASRPVVETVPVLPEVCAGEPDGNCMPATDPYVFAQSVVEDKCRGGGGFMDPQWVTVLPTLFSDEYAGGRELNTRIGVPSAGPGPQALNEIQAVEGFVRESKVSSSDSRLNHFTQDLNFDVELDPIHRRYLMESEARDPMTEDDEGNPTFKSIHQEWESGEVDLSFAPSVSDRISSWGYWIHDCGHSPFVTEIHAPVGVVAHRKRAVPIPDNKYFDEIDGYVGSGVIVPGIISDVYFSRFAGKMSTNPQKNGAAPGLAQPCCTGTGVVYDCSDGSTRACNALCPDGAFGTPRAVLFDNEQEQQYVCQPSQREAIFSFNIYLPPSPKAKLEAAGASGLPELPLHHQILESSIDPGLIDIQRVDEGDTSHLHVRVDLRNTGIGPVRLRIASAWVYPDEENWGLRRWRFNIDRLHVINDADGDLRGSGEWNLWVNLNNGGAQGGHRGWTKILRKDVDTGDDETFGGRRWSTGKPGTDRDLGPDLLLFDPIRFPEQRIHLVASGYEYDGAVRIQDKLELVAAAITPHETVFSAVNVCKGNRSNNPLEDQTCGFYRLYYEIDDLGPVGGALLSQEALDLIAAYANPDCPSGDDVCAPISPTDLPPRVVDPLWYPGDTAPDPNAPPFSVLETRLFELQEVEEQSLTHATANLIFAKVTEADPVKSDDAMRQLRELIDAERLVLPEVLLDVQALRTALPAELWQRHFGDLPRPASPAGLFSGRMAGKVSMMTSAGRAVIQTRLHCDPLDPSNTLSASWAGRTFTLQLVADAVCEKPPLPMAWYRGVGVGTLDGLPGAVAEWTLRDNAMSGPQVDEIELVIRDASGAVVLSADGPIRSGDLKGQQM